MYIHEWINLRNRIINSKLIYNERLLTLKLRVEVATMLENIQYLGKASVVAFHLANPEIPLVHKGTVSSMSDLIGASIEAS